MGCDPDQWGPGTYSLATCSCIVFICSIFLFGFSFDTLDPTEMALMYDGNLCKLDTDTLYNEGINEGGRWFTGVGVNFIGFPKQLQIIKFNHESDADGAPISSKTLDGASVDMGLSLQYKLKRTAFDVAQVYLKFGGEHRRFLSKYSRQITRDVLSRYVVTELWENREAVGSEIKKALTAEFEKRHAELLGFQLLNLDIPEALKEAIVTTTVEFQNIEKAEFELAAEKVSAKTRRLVAEQDAAITVVNAHAMGEAFLIDMRAQAQALNISVAAEKTAYQAIKSMMSMDNQKLFSYMWLDNMLEGTPSKTLLSLKQPADTVSGA